VIGVPRMSISAHRGRRFRLIVDAVSQAHGKVAPSNANCAGPTECAGSSIHLRESHGDMQARAVAIGWRGMALIETCRRQGRDAFKYLQQAVTAWLHNVRAPSLGARSGSHRMICRAAACHRLKVLGTSSRHR